MILFKKREVNTIILHAKHYISKCYINKNKVNTPHFITLHPIQWTMDRLVQTSPPNNRKSRPVYVHTSCPIPLFSYQVAHRTSFLSRQCDVIASFFCFAHALCRRIIEISGFVSKLLLICSLTCYLLFIDTDRSSWPHLDT